jgi:pimeloyl-ACP methyl ester carboxylesterase
MTPPCRWRGPNARRRLIRGAQLAVIPSSGHVTPLEQPDAFNAALEKYLAA